MILADRPQSAYSINPVLLFADLNLTSETSVLEQIAERRYAQRRQTILATVRRCGLGDKIWWWGVRGGGWGLGGGGQARDARVGVGAWTHANPTALHYDVPLSWCNILEGCSHIFNSNSCFFLLQNEAFQKIYPSWRHSLPPSLKVFNNLHFQIKLNQISNNCITDIWIICVLVQPGSCHLKRTKVFVLVFSA